jgi:hypothetical protein
VRARPDAGLAVERADADGDERRIAGMRVYTWLPHTPQLGLADDSSELLAEHAQELDGAWRALSDGLIAGSEAHVDADGRLHADKIDAIADPASLVDCAVSARPRTSARTAGRPSPTLWRSSTLLASSGLWSSRARWVARLPSILP